MGKMPSFMFYPNDWSRDLEEHPLEIEGAWIRILCKLWYSETRGKLTRSLEQWAKILRVEKEKAEEILNYLAYEKISDVIRGSNGDITIISRRMIRDEKMRENNRLRQLRFRQKRKSNAGEMSPSPPFSYSYSFSNNKNNNNIFKEKENIYLKEKESSVTNSVISSLQNSDEISSALEEKTENKIRSPNEFVLLYNEICTNLPKVRKLSKQIKEKIRVRLKECNDRDWWEDVFRKANEIFIPPNDNNPSGWRPNLIFLVRNDYNAIKVADGFYQRFTHHQPGVESFLRKVIEEEENEERRQKNLCGGVGKIGRGDERADNGDED